MIKFNENVWLKPNIDMNTVLRRKAKDDLEKEFFNLMNNADFGKNMQNARGHRDIKRATTERRRNCLVPEPNYDTTRICKENLLVIEIKKVEVLLNKTVCLERAMLELCKTLMYKFWYGYVERKYGEKTKLCYIELCYIHRLYA